MRKKIRFCAAAGYTVVLLMITLCNRPCAAQAPPAAADTGVAEVVRQLQGEVHELRQSVEELRQEAARYRAETQALRKELTPLLAAQARNEPVAAGAGQPPDAGAAANPSPPAASEQRLAKVEEEVQLLNGKLEDQEQTKVESASKYKARIFGMALFNAVSTRGNVDSLDIPQIALPEGAVESSGGAGGTLRQSILGLETFGPQLAGAKTTGDLQFDFAGGFPSTANGATFGIARLRTATLRMDWAQTTIVAGQDTLFFAPLSPSSYASVATPALAYAGNLWAWAPQLRVEHRFDSGITLKAGVLDALTGEYPTASFDRQPTAGEAANQPAYAAHASYTRELFGKEFAVGEGGYFERQNWGFGRIVDGWAAVSNWSVPLTQRFTLSGEFYRGSAIGGLSGGIGQSVLYSNSLGDPYAAVRGLNAAGGWAQLKYAPWAKLEFNGAVGQDEGFGSDFRRAELPSDYYGYYPQRNRALLANMILHPRSDVILAMEYRRLRTYEFGDGAQNANQINLGMGVLF